MSIDDDWPVGDQQMVKTPRDKPISVPGGQWVTTAVIALPKGGRFLCELQVRMPRGVQAGEAHLGRVGWGSATSGGIDETGHNHIPAATDVERWRTPLCHQISGGGPLAFRVWLPEGGTYPVRVVAKALRIT